MFAVAQISNAMATDISHVCIGDCDSDCRVTVDELIVGVNIALGTAAIKHCQNMNRNRDAYVTVDELVAAINSALYGCPSCEATNTPTFTKTPTATKTHTPTGTPTPTFVPEPNCLLAAALGPFAPGQSDQNTLSREQVHQYVDLVPSVAYGVRFFGTTNGLEHGPCYAKEIGLSSFVGVFVNDDPEIVANQLAGLRGVAKCADVVVVGSNAKTYQGVSIEQLLDYACEAKSIVQEEGSNALVTIGERWDVYLSEQHLIKSSGCVDIVFGYSHPFYDADAPNVSEAVDRVVNAYNHLDGAYNMPVYIGETGWPGAPEHDIQSQGLDPRASLENQRLFYQMVLNRPELSGKVVGYQTNDEEWLCGFEKHLCKFGYYYSNLAPKWQVQEALLCNP